MGFTKEQEIKTLGDVWAIFKKHGLEGKYCPLCDQFSQARVLSEQDKIITDLYEACKAALNKPDNWMRQVEQALAKVEGK